MKAQNTQPDNKWIELARSLFNEKEAGPNSTDYSEWDADELGALHQLADQIDLHYKSQQFKADQAYAQVRRAIQSPKTRRANFRWLQLAAAVVLAVLLGSTVFWFSQSGAGPGVVVSQDRFGLQQINLPDGSVVTLNQGSSLQYPDQFDTDRREVQLLGEAFFDVAPNPDQPFVIQARNAQIEVLGTSFNVNAYPDQAEVSVVVATGKVKVSAGNELAGGEKLLLLPGDRGVLRNSDLRLLKSRNDNPNYLAWKTHSFDFEIASLEDVLEQLSTVYRVKITAADPELEKLLLTARFDDQSVQFILEVIARTHDLEIVPGEDGGYTLKR